MREKITFDVKIARLRGNFLFKIAPPPSPELAHECFDENRSRHTESIKETEQFQIFATPQSDWGFNDVERNANVMRFAKKHVTEVLGSTVVHRSIMEFSELVEDARQQVPQASRTA